MTTATTLTDYPTHALAGDRTERIEQYTRVCTIGTERHLEVGHAYSPSRDEHVCVWCLADGSPRILCEGDLADIVADHLLIDCPEEEVIDAFDLVRRALDDEGIDPQAAAWIAGEIADYRSAPLRAIRRAAADAGRDALVVIVGYSGSVYLYRSRDEYDDTDDIHCVCDPISRWHISPSLTIDLSGMLLEAGIDTEDA